MEVWFGQDLKKHCLQFLFASPSSLLAFPPSALKVATALKYRVVTHCMAPNGCEASCTKAGHQYLVIKMQLTWPYFYMYFGVLDLLEIYHSILICIFGVQAQLEINGVQSKTYLA